MRSILCPLLLLGCCSVAWAQTNHTPVGAGPATNDIGQTVPAADESNKLAAGGEVSEQGGTQIYSDTVQLGIKTRTAIYRGHVRLEDPRIHLTCEQLTAGVPEKGSRVDRVVAETNVVIVLIDENGKTNRAYADKAVYTYSVTDTGTNEVVVLTGKPSPRIEREEGVLYGDVIVWDRIRNQIRATNQRMIYHAAPRSPTNAVPPPATPPAVKDTARGAPSAAAEKTPDE